MYHSQVGRVIIGLVIFLVAGLQYSYWFGESGYRQHQQLLAEIQKQEDTNVDLRERNRILGAEVTDLKNGTEAVEEHARLDLGLIKANETFVQMGMIKSHYEPMNMGQNVNSSDDDDD